MSTAIFTIIIGGHDMRNIVKLIVQALHPAFPDHEIYTEALPQGFKEPCFSIVQIDSHAQEYPSKRIYMENHFDIRFFPGQERPRAKCRTMAEQILFLLRELPGLRGRDIEWQVTDDVLHFFVTYARFIYGMQDTEIMGNLHTVQEVKP